MPIQPFLAVLAFAAITLASYLRTKRSSDTVAIVATALFAYHTVSLVIRFSLYFLPLTGLDQNSMGARVLSFFLYGIDSFVLFAAGACLLFSTYSEAQAANAAPSEQ
jgi:hypothetical protein